MSVQDLIRDAAACLTCGKEHKPIPHPTLAPQWGDPDDGHAYRRPTITLAWLRDWEARRKEGKAS